MDDEFYDTNVQQPQQKIKKSGGFESMGLHYSVYQAIKKKGFRVPTPIQRKSIPLIIAGHDIIACSKTGSGKTGAFVIPLINKLKEHCTTVGIRGLIILPTRELALQTASVLKHFTRGTNLLYVLQVGGHGFEGQFETMAQNPDILIATPGRLMQHLEEGRFSLTKVEIVIYDEADFLFEMGLADQLKTILKYLPPTKQSLIFSATIPEQLSLFAQVGLKDYIYVKLDKEYTLPENMMIHFLIISSEHRLSALLLLLRRIGEVETSIVFASTKYQVDLIVYMLEQCGISAVSVYGKMDQFDRREQLNSFKSGYCKVMVVTDLASRGLDIPFVNNVIHFDYPSKSKIFIHRSGRTARAGRKGTVYTLLQKDELYFIHETMLFAGRKLVNKCDDLEDTSKAYYGSIPIDSLQNSQTKIDFLQREDPEFQKLQDIAKKANEKFLKTRGTASQGTIKNKIHIEINQIHPLFAKDMNQDEDTKDMLTAIREFRPQQSYIELKRIQQVRTKSVKNFEQGTDKFLSAVNTLKKIQDQKHKQRDKRKQMLETKQRNEQEFQQNSDNEEVDFKQQVRQVQQVQYSGQGKLKRNQMVDFRHPTQFIEAQPDYSKKNEFDELNKIQTNDINNFIVGEDLEDLANRHKRHMWDKDKKKFVFGSKNQAPKKIKDKDDKDIKDDKIQSQFSKWKRRNQMTIQQVGEQEDTQMSYRAKQMFQRRQMRGKGFYFNDQVQGGGGRSEIKNVPQLLKSKKIKKNLQIKNMPKDKRRQIEKKNRNLKQQNKRK